MACSKAKRNCREEVGEDQVSGESLEFGARAPAVNVEGPGSNPRQHLQAGEKEMSVFSLPPDQCQRYQANGPMV